MMSIRDAITYLLKNLRIILTITLSMTIAFILLFELLVYVDLDVDEAPGLFLFILFMLGFMSLAFGFILFTLGYGMRVIRHTQLTMDTKMPPIQPVRDLGRGIVIGFSGFITLLPIFSILIIVSPFIKLNGSLLNILIFILVAPIVACLIWAFIIGILRCARHNKATLLFDFQVNLSHIRNNVSKLLMLTLYIFIVTIIYLATWTAIVTYINNLFVYPYSQSYWQIGWFLSIFISIAFYLIYTLILSQLIAQLGGLIAVDKRKNSVEKVEMLGE